MCGNERVGVAVEAERARLRNVVCYIRMVSFLQFSLFSATMLLLFL